MYLKGFLKRSCFVLVLPNVQLLIFVLVSVLVYCNYPDSKATEHMNPPVSQVLNM